MANHVSDMMEAEPSEIEPDDGELMSTDSKIPGGMYDSENLSMGTEDELLK